MWTSNKIEKNFDQINFIKWLTESSNTAKIEDDPTTGKVGYFRHGDYFYDLKEDDQATITWFLFTYYEMLLYEVMDIHIIKCPVNKSLEIASTEEGAFQINETGEPNNKGECPILCCIVDIDPLKVREKYLYKKFFEWDNF